MLAKQPQTSGGVEGGQRRGNNRSVIICWHLSGGDMYPDGDALKPVGIKTAMCSNSQETHLAEQPTVRCNAPTCPF